MTAKRPRKDQVLDRNMRVNITNEMIIQPLKEPRYMPPYFAHEPLNPTLYAGGISDQFHSNSTLGERQLTTSQEWASPIERIFPNLDKLPYDIEKYDIEKDQDEEMSDDEDDAEDIEQNFNAVLPRTNTEVTSDPSTTPAAQSSPDADRIVIGPRPLEGRGRKLCGLEDMDEDDKLIYYLKLAKWTERAIHEKFVSEGRTNYNQKTIGTRFARMRRFIMAENDQRLKEGTAIWLEAEDKLLPEAIAFATQQIEEERLALQQRKWQLVSEYIQKHEPLAMYSGEACRERYETMMRPGSSGDANHRNKRLRDPKIASLRHERLQQVALLEHFKHAESL